MVRVRFMGRDMVSITFSDGNVVPGSTKYVDPARNASNSAKPGQIRKAKSSFQ